MLFISFLDDKTSGIVHHKIFEITELIKRKVKNTSSIPNQKSDSTVGEKIQNSPSESRSHQNVQESAIYEDLFKF